jgi:uncharacterized protein YdeI (YjbR/CyaY-like superfamily)
MDEALFFKEREEWRSWLANNHHKLNYVWLIFYKNNFSKNGISLDESVEEAICFGWIDGKLRKIDDEKFILRFSPRKAKSVWSRINRKRAEKLIKLGKMTDAGLMKIKEAKESGYWSNAYTNKVKETIPSDLKKVLMEDKKAWNNFQNFANSYRNIYISWINSAKTDETRKKRIDKVVEQSLQNKKLINF